MLLDLEKCADSQTIVFQTAVEKVLGSQAEVKTLT